MAVRIKILIETTFVDEDNRILQTYAAGYYTQEEINRMFDYQNSKKHIVQCTMCKESILNTCTVHGHIRERLMGQ